MLDIPLTETLFYFFIFFCPYSEVSVSQVHVTWERCVTRSLKQTWNNVLRIELSLRQRAFPTYFLFRIF